VQSPEYRGSKKCPIWVEGIDTAWCPKGTVHDTDTFPPQYHTGPLRTCWIPPPLLWHGCQCWVVSP
jgi:hypothetical protein